MKKIFGYLTIVLLLALLSACSTAGPTSDVTSLAESQNLIKNGSFNEGEKNWVFYANTKEGVTYKEGLDSYGRYCVWVGKAGPNPWSIGFYQQGFQLEKGITYTLSFKVATSVGKTASVKVKATESQEPYVEYAYSTQTVNGGNLQTKTISFTMAEREDSGRIAFQLGGTADNQYYCFDDISLTH
ncbi:MAG: carbohydrate binding domain-containing protein [Trueperaceae bacterium]